MDPAQGPGVESERLAAIRNVDPDAKSNLMNALVLGALSFVLGLAGPLGAREARAGGQGGDPRRVKMDVVANEVDRELAGKELEELASKYGIEVVYRDPSEANRLLKEDRAFAILGGPDARGGVGRLVREFLNGREQDSVRKSGSAMVFEKENPYNGGKVYIIAGATRNETLRSVGLDHDKDGIPTGMEVLLYNHPLEKSYGLINLTLRKKVKDVEALRLFGVVDEDGKVDGNERTMINVFEDIRNGSFMPEVYRKDFWSKEELEDYARRFIKTVVEDGKVGKDEVDAVRAMMSKYRWKDGRGGIIFDLIDGKALSSENLGKDFDGDGHSNMEEILEGFNPFNKLEWPGCKDGYSRVFYVGVNGTVFRYHPLTPFFIPMMMLKYGIQPENMKILVQEWKGSKIGTLRDWRHTTNRNFWGWFAGKNVYKMFKDVGGELYSLDETTTPQRFFQAIQETVEQMDGNDFLIVYYHGHGPVPSIVKYGIKYTGGYEHDYNLFSWKDVSEILKGGEGRKIVIIDSCYAENAIRDNFDLTQAYFIGTSKLNEETGGEKHIITIATKLGEGYRVKELYNKANVCQDGSCEIGEVNPVKWVKKP